MTSNENINWSGMEAWLVSEAMPRITQIIDRYNAINPYGLVAILTSSNSSAHRDLWSYLPSTKRIDQRRQELHVDTPVTQFAVPLKDEEMRDQGTLLDQIISQRWDGNKRLWEGTRYSRYPKFGPTTSVKATLRPDKTQWLLQQVD